MTTARITVDREFTIGSVPRRLFGSFVEHMGRCVYTGIYEPGHETADEKGFRRDVLDLTKELGATVVRYPGGNFVSGYNWEDGVGPVDQRPRRLDGAWHTVETNAFGLHEFVEWSKLAGVEVMEAVNLGTRGVDAARELVEYANHPGGTALSDRRIANGAADPFDIKLWCLGNELDGPWQIGHKTADRVRPPRAGGRQGDEVRRPDASSSSPSAARAAACRPSAPGSTRCSPTPTTRSTTSRCTPTTRSTTATRRASSRRRSTWTPSSRRSSRPSTASRPRASTTSRSTSRSTSGTSGTRRGLDTDDQPHNVSKGWVEHPRLIEDEYNVTDAVVVGTFLNSLLRHGDRVKIANQAQLVNVIAPIRSEQGGPAWRQTIFWPFARMAALAQGEILRTARRRATRSTPRSTATPTSSTSARPGTRRPGASRSSSPTADSRRRRTSSSSCAASRTAGSSAPRCWPCRRAATASPPTREQAQDAVGLVPLDGVTVDGGSVRLTLPALSWAVVELEVAKA